MGKSDTWIEKVEYTEPTENEKKMLEGTLNPEQLLEKERQDALQPPEGKIDKDRRREYITQVKCYALTKIGKKPLDNPSTFNQETKIKLMETMDEIIKTMSEEQIKTENLYSNRIATLDKMLKHTRDLMETFKKGE